MGSIETKIVEGGNRPVPRFPSRVRQISRVGRAAWRERGGVIPGPHLGRADTHWPDRDSAEAGRFASAVRGLCAGRHRAGARRR